jgi:hypothetical protein
MDHSRDSCDVPGELDSNSGLGFGDISATTDAANLFAGRNEMAHIKVLMPGNQSFDQSLYAPLTRPPLTCPPEVHFLKDGVHEA